MTLHDDASSQGGLAAVRVRLGGPDLRHQLQEFTDTTAAYEAGEDVVPGDCWRACLASLLEVPLAEVPHFIHLFPDAPPADPAEAESERRLIEMLGPRWWRESVAWVQFHRPGWTLAAWERPNPWHPIYHRDMYEQGLLERRVILTAPSPRGAWHHSVIVDAVTADLVHDPFPGGQGVLDGPGDVVCLVKPEWLEE